MTNYLLTGGGTAGHVNPLLTVAKELVARNAQDQIFVLGTTAGLEARLVPEAGFPLLTIERVPFPRRLNLSAIAFPFRFIKAVGEVERYLEKYKIDAVIGFGGYVSAPAYQAARRKKLPLIIHEANALPGIANRFGNRFANAAAVAFRSTQLANSEFVGMPLRPEIIALAAKKDKAKARRHFGLRPDTLTLLVTGGSLGARSINQTIEKSRTRLAAAGIQVLHIVGQSSELEEERSSDFCRIKYLDQMELALEAADFAVARAGAATVSEFTAVGLPALYIPYPVGNGEQKFNLLDVVAAGGGISIADHEFTPEYVHSELIPLLSDSKRLAEMEQAARQAGVLTATSALISLIDEVISRR